MSHSPRFCNGWTLVHPPGLPLAQFAMSGRLQQTPALGSWSGRSSDRRFSLSDLILNFQLPAAN